MSYWLDLERKSLLYRSIIFSWFQFKFNVSVYNFPDSWRQGKPGHNNNRDHEKGRTCHRDTDNAHHSCFVFLNDFAVRPSNYSGSKTISQPNKDSSVRSTSIWCVFYLSIPLLQCMPQWKSTDKQLASISSKLIFCFPTKISGPLIWFLDCFHNKKIYITM